MRGSCASVYMCAGAQRMRMVEELAHMAPADGSFAVASARRAEALALHELTRTMKVYADVMVKHVC
jgi:predicted TIM-barrel enzyme